MPIPDGDVACHHGGWGRQFRPRGPHLLLAGLSPPPQDMTHLPWFPLLAASPPRQGASQGYPPSTSWSPSYCLSMGVRDKGVFYHCGDITEILNSTGDSLCTWKRKHSSALWQICVDRNVTCTGDKSFISFFARILLAGLGQGLEERGQRQAKSDRQRADLPPALPAPALRDFTGGCTGLCVCRTWWSFRPDTGGMHYNIIT